MPNPIRPWDRYCTQTVNDYFLIYSILRNNISMQLIPSNKPKTYSIDYFYKKNHESKVVRKIFADSKYSISSFASVQFFNLYYNSEFNLVQTKNFLDVWAYSFLPIEVRNFALLRNNNKLVLNYQLSRFSNRGTHCTFCFFYPTTYESMETAEHLFFECPSTNSLVKNILTISFLI